LDYNHTYILNFIYIYIYEVIIQFELFITKYIVTSLTETRNVFEKKKITNILSYNCNYTYYWRHL